jgi:hypothetical protein
MHKNILFLQIEIIRDCPPHMGMCLFVDDLRKSGVNCDTYIINANYINEIIPLIRKGNYSLICLDSVFTIEIIALLEKEFSYLPIIVGGINAVALLVHTNIQYAVFGPGRAAISAFIQEFYGSKNFYNVPNMFFKDGNQILYSGKTEHWDLERELFPYVPFLDWQYIGPDRNPKANYIDVSIVAGTGCLYANSTLSSNHFAINDIFNELGYKASDAALQRLEEIFNRKRHGCSFCIFQYQEFTSYSAEDTIELLLKQALHLYNKYKTTSFHIQTENPLPFLYDFITALLKNKIGIQKLGIRTRPDLLLLHKDKLTSCLELARDKDIHLSIEEIGFESFVDDDLNTFNKNTDSTININALKLLKDVKEKFGKHVSVDVGHGLILFHPWTTLKNLTENIEFISKNNDIFPRFFLGTLVLYSEFLPIYPKISHEGLTRKSKYGYGLIFTIKDDLARKAYDLYEILLTHFGGNISSEAYLKSLELIGKHSIDQILKEIYYLVPVQEK